MAIHVYLQMQDKTSKEPLRQFRYRGEAGPDDDPQSFKKTMARRNLAVILSPDVVHGPHTAGIVGDEQAVGLGWLT